MPILAMAAAGASKIPPVRPQEFDHIAELHLMTLSSSNQGTGIILLRVDAILCMAVPLTPSRLNPMLCALFDSTLEECVRLLTFKGTSQ